MKSVEDIMKGFEEFLKWQNIKETSIPAYKNPIKALLEMYMVKEEKDIIEKEDLVDFIKDLERDLEYYSQSDIFDKYKNWEKALEYFRSYVNYKIAYSLDIDDIPEKHYYVIKSKTFGDLKVEKFDRDKFGWFLLDINGKELMLNPADVLAVEKYKSSI